MSKTPRKRRVALTVDVEAHLLRTDRDHVSHLIWGRQNGREAGIQTMMDIADRHGVPMTFFLDYPEAELYGEELLDVGREIHRRGHDLEPHCHTEYLMRPLFALEDPLAVRVTRASLAQSLNIVDYLVERHVQLTGKQPLAHRSGAYMLGANYLKALRQRGFLLDASYNPLCTEDPMTLGIYGAFRWSHGLRELPIPLVAHFRKLNRLVPWNFHSHPFIAGNLQENLQAHRDFLNAWFNRHGDDAVATLVMHSWSFWKMDANGHFTIPAEDVPELFDALLTMLGKEYAIVSVGQIAEEEMAAPAPLEVVEARSTAPVCPVCYEPASHFQDYGAPKRQCPFCKSVERHRTLVELVYAGSFGPRVFHGKDVLHIAPGRPEKLLLRRMYNCRVTTLNILPGCDIQADLQAMPELEDNAFDVVLASEVFRHVRHLDRALAEIARVLRPGGFLLCSDCLDNTDKGHEITDPAEQIAWYGREKLETYGIGDFRRFGRKDWETAFTPRFFTRLFKTDDKATGTPAWWLACVPRPVGGARQTAPVMTEALLRSNAGRILLDAAHDPLQTFLPDFRSWTAYCQHAAAKDLVWLKKVIFALHFSPLKPLKLGLPQHGDFPHAYPADFHPYSFQSFYYLLPSLFFDPGFGDSPQLRHMLAELERWIDTYGYYTASSHLDPHTRVMVWHDAAVATRCNVMSYVLLRSMPLRQCSNDVHEKIFRSALDHFLLLCTDHFFTGHHNHGLLQILGMLAFASAWPHLNGASAIPPLAAKRLKVLLDHMVGPDAIVREHSPEYHAAIMPLLTDIAAFLPDTASCEFPLSPFMAHIRSTLAHFVKPNGSLVPFGDTPPQCGPTMRDELPRIASLCRDISPLTLFPDAGYAFLRIHHDGEDLHRASYIALQGAFHSRVHKHCDDLGFIWSEGSQDILVDSGQQYGYEGKINSGPLWEKGFDYTVPNRIYSESIHAHNCVEINGESYSRRTPPYGSLPLSGEQLSETCWLLQGEWRRPEDFRQWRRLVFSPNRWLLVLDTLQPCHGDPSLANTFSQWFHCDATIDLVSYTHDTACFLLPNQRTLHCQNLTTGTLSTHKGEFAPRLQGWQASEHIYQLNPAWAVGIHQTAPEASFRTLFSLIGPCTAIKDCADVYNLHFADGSVSTFSLKTRQDRAS